VWNYVRCIARRTGHPALEEPAQVRDEAAFRAVVYQVLSWCGEIENQQASRVTAGGQATRHVEGGKPDRRRAIPKEEADILVRDYLKGHPAATVREIHLATGVSTGAIVKTPAWQVSRASKSPDDDAPAREPRTRQLTPKMLASVGKEEDPSSRLEADERAWRYLLESAKPGERARLNALKPAERAQLIRAARAQLEDRTQREDPEE
jgi:hypothetical protein